MLVLSAKPMPKKTSEKLPFEVSEAYLRHVVASIAYPRHFEYEAEQNWMTRNWIENEFKSLGLATRFQGSYDNIIATCEGVSIDECSVIIGAHYDSVPGSPGADDNASAVAGVLAAAKALKGFAPPVMFVAFNREEDGMLGSEEFVTSLGDAGRIRCTHILEMIGYCSHEPGSQSVPERLPIKISDVGDFIAIIANRHSNHLVQSIIKTAERFVPALHVKALKVFLGAEKFFPHLSRSDLGPFWEKGVPAMMWTDTAEFRNANYHQPSDLPQTLDYTFMRRVVELLCASVMASKSARR